MALEYRCPTIQELRDIDLPKLIEPAKTKECWQYNSIFLAKTEEAEKGNDEPKYSAFRLLSDITSLHLRANKPKEPFGPMIVMNGKRSAIVDDITNEQLDLLKQFAPEISDSELLARIADIVWIRKRDFKMAQVAIEAYIESAVVLEDWDHWPPCFDRIERAFRLAASLGQRAGHLAKVVSHIEALLIKCNGEDPLYLSEKLMELLCSHELGDTALYGSWAEKAANRAEDARDWRRAEIYWRRKAEWDRIAKDEPNRKKSLINAANTYVKLAEASVCGDRPSYLAACHHLTNGIEAFRRIGGMKDRVNELLRVLVDYQEKSLKEFQVFKSPPIDLSKVIDEACESVKGKSMIEALYELAQGFRVEAANTIRKRVENNIKNHPFSHLMGGTLVNQKGKVVGKRSAILLETGDEYENAILSHMFAEAKISYSVDVPALVEPMRLQIELEHYTTIDDLSPITLNNPLIPQHREYLYAKGLLSGLQGDFITAIHILVPQFEHSVRYLLEQNGVATSGIDQEGIQEEFDLNRLLHEEKIKELFGEDVVFHLRCLLVEREGANIRNRMAHGLMYPGDFHAPECKYLWALILKLCCWPSMMQIYRTQINAGIEQGTTTKDNPNLDNVISKIIDAPESDPVSQVQTKPETDSNKPEEV